MLQNHEHLNYPSWDTHIYLTLTLNFAVKIKQEMLMDIQQNYMSLNLNLKGYYAILILCVEQLNE